MAARGSISKVGLLVVPALVIIGVAFFYPLGDVFWRSLFDVVEPRTAPFGNYDWFFSTPVNIVVLKRTFVTAALVTVICLVMAYPYAYMMTRASGRMKLLLIGMVMLPFWTSLMVRNHAWVVLLQDNGPINDIFEAVGIGRKDLIGTLTGVTIGMVQVLLPFMVLPLYSVMQGIDPGLMRAAQSLGAKPAVAFFRVHLPLSLPGVIAGSLLVFVLSLGFYVTPALLGSPQESLISQLMFNQVNDLLAFGQAGAMAGVLLTATLILLSLVAVAIKRSPVGRGVSRL